MRLALMAATCGLLLMGQASALPIGAPHAGIGADLVLGATSSTRSFRSCMRKRYGPHYYRGVKRAYRYFMAQACGG